MPGPPPGRAPAAPPQGHTVVVSPGATGELVVVSGPDGGQRFPLGPNSRVGRATDNEIALRDNQVSRHHAAISFTGAGYVITDLGSANGTWVNGQRIAQPTPLRPGDNIRIGTDQLVLH